jgi:glycosyltransferase involved in cell wall biosynthesis
MKKLSIVIPVLNEEVLISELVKQVKNNSQEITKDFEIILVDDGSIDNTWEKICFEANSDDRVKGLKFSRNFGHHFAITAGLHETNSDWVVVMDGDLQDRPEVIPELFKKAQQGFDVVFVSRKNRPEGIIYKLTQKLFYGLLRLLSGIRFDSRQANFSIISNKVVQSFKTFPENARFYGSTIMWLGFKRTYILADHGRRYLGKPSYTIRKRFKLAFDIIVAFSDRPLKFAIGLGILLSSVSILLALIIVYGAIKWKVSIEGWQSATISILFLNGTILIFLGILGIYMGRVFQEVKKRPLYIIESKVNSES